MGWLSLRVGDFPTLCFLSVGERVRRMGVGAFLVLYNASASKIPSVDALGYYRCRHQRFACTARLM